MPNRGLNMGDGWETKRRRDHNNDWAVIKLGLPGTIRKVILDTAHFKGNYPDQFSLQAAHSADSDTNLSWQTILEKTPLRADYEHLFIEQLLCSDDEEFTHVKVNIYPDGGISRLRIFGFPNWEADNMDLQQINNLDKEKAHHLFMQCCTSERWVEKMVAGRPYIDSNSLRQTADRHWNQMTEDDYLQAFEGHPKIGDITSLKAKYANTKELASDEQAGVKQAYDQLMIDLAEDNRAYEEKYGFIFIVCATGKSAEEMLNLLRVRLKNTRHRELEIASEEQRKIFHLRLEKIL